MAAMVRCFAGLFGALILSAPRKYHLANREASI